eukprot:1090067-Karenia_brevis.AAC.1
MECARSSHARSYLMVTSALERSSSATWALWEAIARFPPPWLQGEFMRGQQARDAHTFDVKVATLAHR